MEGYLPIVGRSKGLIIIGGFNVYPREIEDGLNDIDGVAESATFSVPDADFGEAIIAAEGLAATVTEKLARFTPPRCYQFVSPLPRNVMGKVQKNFLRDSFAAGLMSAPVLSVVDVSRSDLNRSAKTHGRHLLPLLFGCGRYN